MRPSVTTEPSAAGSPRAVPFVVATRSDDRLTGPDGRRHQAKNLVALAERGSGNGVRPGEEPRGNGSMTEP
jgi:hypothetical protein